MTSIGSNAFYGCTGLTSISLPDSVTIIGDYAFYGCTDLVYVFYLGTNEQWNLIEVNHNNNVQLFNAQIHFEAENHLFGDWVEEVHPSCEEPGIKHRDCLICEEREIVIIPEIGHVIVTDEYQAPTCFETGLSEGAHCSVCGKILIAQEIINVIGDGEGTEEKPYLLYSISDLEYFRDRVNSGDSFECKYIRLMADITLNEPDVFLYNENGTISGTTDEETINWFVPIGAKTDNYSRKFSGVFDGNGHIIYGLYNDTGLFASVQNGVVRDLCLFGGFIKSENGGPGGIVSSCLKSKIINCNNFNSVLGNSTVGGIAGNCNESIIQNCCNHGPVTQIRSDGTGIGGIVGKLNGGIIVDCCNKGIVTARNTYYLGSLNAGGIAGVCSGGLIANCNNNGVIIGDSRAGGISGELNARGQIVNCFNVGDISGSFFVGGITGLITDSQNSSSVIVSNCYNIGPVTKYGTGEVYIGGIVGQSSGKIINNCFNTGLVKANAARFEAGGVVGNGIAQNCYNLGIIDVKVKENSSGNSSYVGGIVARGDAIECYYLNNNDFSGILRTTVSEAGTILSNEQMLMPSYYAGYDFIHTWIIDENDYYPYPRLFGIPLEIGDGGIVINAFVDNNPYLIYTLEDFEAFRDSVNSGDTYYGKTIKLMNNIIMNDKDVFSFNGNGVITGIVNVNGSYKWTAIGNENVRFCGIFDGNGFEIKGLYMNYNSRIQALFGNVTLGEIKNLGVVNGLIKKDNEGYTSGCVSAGLATILYCSTISNCYNSCTIDGLNSVGGIAGNVWNSNVTNCFNSGMIKSSDLYSGVAVSISGNSIIKNCYNVGRCFDSSYSLYIVKSISNDSNLINCFNKTPENKRDNNSILLTDEQMRDAISFSGFDFVNVWTMDGDPDYPYPELRKSGSSETCVHSYGEWIIDNDSKCESAGIKHHVCTFCGEEEFEEIPAKGHDLIHFDEKRPTCTEAGWNAYDKCSRCDYSSYEEISALGHDWGEWTITVEPTETSFGEKKRACTVCGNEETQEIDPIKLPFVVSVSDATGIQGDTVTVNVVVESNPGIIASQLEITYDSSILKLESIASGVFGAGSGEYIFSSKLDDIPQIICWQDALATVNNTSTGLIAEMRFTILNLASIGDFEITLTSNSNNTFDSNNEPVDVVANSGTVHVVRYAHGDVNHDGNINLKDYVTLKRYVNGWNVEVDAFLADVNGDGVINLKDYVLLKRFVNGWNVELKYGKVS